MSKMSWNIIVISRFKFAQIKTSRSMVSEHCGLNLIWAAIGKKSKIFWRTRRVNVFCMKEHCEEMKIYIWTNKGPRFCWVQILRDQYFSDGKVFFCKFLPTIFKQIIHSDYLCYTIIIFSKTGAGGIPGFVNCLYNGTCSWESLDFFQLHYVCLMVLNTTFNNISVISWRSVLLVEETGGPRENHQPVTSQWQTLSHNVVHLALIEIQTHNISGDRHRLHR